MLPHFLKLHSKIHEENIAVFTLVLGETSFIGTSLTKIVPVQSTPRLFGPTFSQLAFTQRPHSSVFGIFSPWLVEALVPDQLEPKAVQLFAGGFAPRAVRSRGGGGVLQGHVCRSGGWSQGLRVQLHRSPHMWLQTSHLTIPSLLSDKSREVN